jgi:hypothetical protein
LHDNILNWGRNVWSRNGASYAATSRATMSCWPEVAW